VTSFEDRFYLGQAGRWRRLGRDWRLGLHLLGLAWWWLTVGARVRREYRAAQRSGETIHLDGLDGGRE
jgi:hypothetical protein